MTYRLTAWLRSKLPQEVFWSRLLAQARTPRASCPGPCPARVLISLRSETPQPPGQALTVLDRPHSKKVEVLALVFQFMSFASGPVTGHR